MQGHATRLHVHAKFHCSRSSGYDLCRPKLTDDDDDDDDGQWRTDTGPWHRLTDPGEKKTECMIKKMELKG